MRTGAQQAKAWDRTSASSGSQLGRGRWGAAVALVVGFVLAFAGGAQAAPFVLTSEQDGQSTAATMASTVLTVHSGHGVTLKAFVTGSRRIADPVVVVNGGPGQSHATIATIAPLARRTGSLVLYDQRGTGASSSPPAGSYTLADQVADLDAVRRALHATRLRLVGHSFGGMIAAAYAAAHPSRVKDLVLADAEPLDPNADNAGNAPFQARVQQLQSEGFIPNPVPGPSGDDCSPTINALAPAYFSDPRHAGRFRLTGRRSCSVNTLGRASSEITDADRKAALDALRHFHGRTLVIAGADDPFGQTFLAGTAHEVAAAHPKRVTLPHAGHLAWLEAPRWFSIVGTFLKHRPR